MSKIYKILSTMGYMTLQLTTMLVIAFFLVSVKIVKEEVDNPYCKIANQNIQIELNFDSIDYYTYEIHCNTLNTEIYLKENINKESAISLLLEIKQSLEQKSLTIQTHITMMGNLLNNPIYASLNLGHQGISYIGG